MPYAFVGDEFARSVQSYLKSQYDALAKTSMRTDFIGPNRALVPYLPYATALSIRGELSQQATNAAWEGKPVEAYQPKTVSALIEKMTVAMALVESKLGPGVVLQAQATYDFFWAAQSLAIHLDVLHSIPTSGALFVQSLKEVVQEDWDKVKGILPSLSIPTWMKWGAIAFAGLWVLEKLPKGGR
jgi:hypothetical protein